jgi:hypothetical protein
MARIRVDTEELRKSAKDIAASADAVGKAAATSLNQSHATGIFGAPTARVDPNPGGVVSVSIQRVFPSFY